MKWRNAKGRKEDEVKIRKPYEKKYKCRFAFFPVALDSGDSVWLECYIKEYTWSPNYECWYVSGKYV